MSKTSTTLSLSCYSNQSPPFLCNPTKKNSSPWFLRSFIRVLSGGHHTAMVSIRRRRLLGLSSGRDPVFAPLPRVFEHGHTHETGVESAGPSSVHPFLPTNNDMPKEESTFDNGTGSSKGSSSILQEDNFFQQFPEIKRRKRHRRKHVENQEPCIMRGVYLKNAKWQAAIKVDKKQIHLGTVGSQEEAARLYDRAAFMCGREPNFELSEEEKRELKKFKWEEFLAMTRSAISYKKVQRRTGPGSLRKHQNNDSEGEQERGFFSASEDDT
ncbi:ethylene-responsive transcription factor-like protein At4g13040 isoform X2 [Primulina eburnea]|uniref:ethylene-responsive transcription factor-like protein At4g13040 isoform X2 n=1 Tax=Primulina eburnea TaxID=1245227 RepID=UPI003C6C2224